MDHIPYGNTLLVKWHIKRGGAEQPLTGLDLSLTMTLPNGDVKNMPFSITDGNVINMLYEGKDQEHIGEYYLDLYENRGIISQLRIDAAPAFHLVAHTFQAQRESDPNLEVYTIELEGDIDVNTPSNAVTFTPQLLTDGQQAQARDNINAKRGGYARLQKVAPYCAEIWFDGVDYEAADRYFAGNYEAQIGACTAVFKNGMLGRNFDWPYSDYTGFLVRTPAISGRHAVMGGSGYLPGLTDAVVDSGVWNEKYNLLPFLMVDGINDAGLSAAVLVCENKGVTPTTGTNPGEKRMNGLFIVRYALDNHTDALEAANDIAQNFDVYMPHTETADEELHYVFCDKTQMVILEFSNNEAHVITGKNWLTNFKVFGTTQNADGTIDYSTVHPYGQGCERYDEIAKFGAGGDIPEEQTPLFLAYVLILMRYTNAYAENSTWLTEFTGIHDELTVQAAASTPDIFAQTMEVARQRFLERDRQIPETWQTCHSVVYDSKTLTAYINVQEADGFVTRQLSGPGLTPSEVRNIVHEETDDAIESKQDTISDLASIRSGASAGATAVQPGDLPTFGNIVTHDADEFLPSSTEIPSKTSDLTNDSGFITSADIADKADKYVTQSKAETSLSLAINATAFPKPTILTYGTLTAFELTEVATITNEVVITFSVGASPISITIPSGTKYVGDLTTKANESYVMSILDGVVIMSNYKSQA